MILFLTNEVSKKMNDNQSKNGDIGNIDEGRYSPGAIVKDAKGKLWEKLPDDNNRVDCSSDSPDVSTASLNGNKRSCVYGDREYEHNETRSQDNVLWVCNDGKWEKAE